MSFLIILPQNNHTIETLMAKVKSESHLMYAHGLIPQVNDE
jgi:hypothetical protein